jgi:hypothetical protein
MTIQIAFEFGEQVGNQGMEVARRNARMNIREEPSAHRMVDLTGRPMALYGRFPCCLFDDGSQELRALWKNRIWKSLRFPHGLQPGNRSYRFGEETVQRDIEAEVRSLHIILFYLHLQPPATNQKEALRTVQAR